MFEKWIKSAQVYCDRRMLAMLLLGFSSGFPLLLVFGTLNLWLKDAGVTLAVIGLFSLAKTPYSLKWAWSPIVDRFRLPLFGRLGRRRGWALFTQIWLMSAICGMAMTDPAQTPRLGTIFSGAGALFLAEVMSWGDVYKIMALGAAVGMLTILFSKEPQKEENYNEIRCEGNWHQRLRCFLNKAVVAPFADFMKRQNWLLILVFVFLYRMSDAYIGPMMYPFYDDMGFSKREIASITKIYGVAATVGGTLLGGIVVNRLGIIRALLICGVLQGVSNLVFVAQAYAGHNVYMLMGTVAVENISGGMGTAAFVAYLSSLCNVAYTATQYALLSSLMSFARDIFASTSGFLAGSVSWSSFFVITTLMALPGMLVLLYMVSRMKLLPAKPYMADGRK